MTAATSPASPRALRVARAVGASTTATLVALAFHVSAGGVLPPLLLLAAVCVLSWLPAIALIGRRASLGRQTIVIALSELALHAVFSVGVAPVADGSAMAGMPGMAGMSGMPTTAVAAAPASALMWAAHAAAAALTVLAWNRGEAALGSMARLVRVVVRDLLGFRLPAPVLLDGPHPAAIAPAPPRLLSRHPVLAARRGPPLLRTTS